MAASPSQLALAALTDKDKDWLRKLPKAELHAHLNGSIPLECLRALARERAEKNIQDWTIVEGIRKLEEGVELDRVEDFFGLFPAIYALTSTPAAIRRATLAVLEDFAANGCFYLELRTTPREVLDKAGKVAMDMEQYLRSVIVAMEEFDQSRNGQPETQMRTALIVATDRRMSPEVADRVVDLALSLRGQTGAEGSKIVGVDLCGDVSKGDIPNTPPGELRDLLSLYPDRLGHATFLQLRRPARADGEELTFPLAGGSSRQSMQEEAEASLDLVLERRTPIEICLSSNLICKTVPDLESHHLHFLLERRHPFAICTDDTLPFRTSLVGEYALLLAQAPVGLGLTHDEVERIARDGMRAGFTAQ